MRNGQSYLTKDLPPENASISVWSHFCQQSCLEFSAQFKVVHYLSYVTASSTYAVNMKGEAIRLFNSTRNILTDKNLHRDLYLLFDQVYSEPVTVKSIMENILVKKALKAVETMEKVSELCKDKWELQVMEFVAATIESVKKDLNCEDYNSLKNSFSRLAKLIPED